MDRFTEMTTFVSVVDAGSLSAASRQLGSSLPAVSRQLSALESRLGTRLVHRTTRKLRLTEAGEAFYGRCVRILGDVEEAEDDVANCHGELRGRLSLSVPVVFGRLHVIPLLPLFLTRFPHIVIDLQMDDRPVDLIGEGIDVAVRVGPPPDTSSLNARKLGRYRRVTCGTPAYLAQRGVPSLPTELADHNCLVFARDPNPEWRFRGEDGHTTIVRPHAVLLSNNADAVREAVLAGSGLALLPTWVIQDALDDGRLETVLKAFEPAGTAVHALYPRQTRATARVRAFVDFLVSELAPSAE